MERGDLEDRLADATRKMAILRSNEAIMVRRYHVLEDSESMLRKETGKLKEDLVLLENGVLEKMGSLQR
jgi:hypothetical protein